MTHEEWLDEQLTEWLGAGPHDVPSGPIQAAVAHARAHPHRRLPATGLGRNLMDRMHLTSVEPRPTSRMAFSIAGVAVVIVLVVAAGGFLLAGAFGDQPGGVAAPVAPDGTPTPAPTSSPASPSPTSSTAPLPTPPIAVTGLGSCVNYSDGTASSKDGITQYRGVVLKCRMTTSDPRLEGAVTVDVSIDERSDGSADIWGVSTIANEAGTWMGPWAGTVDSGYTTHHMTGLYVGSGAYHGLRLRYDQESGDGKSSWLTGSLEAVDTVPPEAATVVLGASCQTRSQGTQTTVGEVLQVRGIELDCTGPSSDPRLDGTRHVTVDIDQNPDESAAMSGTVEIFAPGGAWNEPVWTGPFTGTIDAGYTTHRMDGVLVGSGANAGLELRYSQIGEDGKGYVMTGTLAATE